MRTVFDAEVFFTKIPGNRAGGNGSMAGAGPLSLSPKPVWPNYWRNYHSGLNLKIY